MSKRRDRCAQCNKVMVWETDKKDFTCKSCGKEYRVECDSVLEYWLEEKRIDKPVWRSDMK